MTRRSLAPRLPSGPVTPPAQRPADAPRGLPRDPGLPALYGDALRHLAARTGLLLGNVALTVARWGTTETRATARNRAVAAGHPSTRPRLAVVPTGIAQGRADAQFTHSPLACLGIDCPTHREDHR